MLQTNTRMNQGLELGANARRRTHNQNTAEIERTLRKKRSSRYMQAMSQLDTGSHVTNQKQTAELIQIVRDEFDELDMDITEAMLGIVSECLLGPPYEVYTLDFTYSI